MTGAVALALLVATGDEAMARYLADLEKTRRLPAETASESGLKTALAHAEDLLLRGDARAATSALYVIVEAPRFAPWRDTPSFQNAEFLLGRALARGGARLSAERYLTAALAHGPDAPYFVPAQRALVDLALETRAYGHVAQVIAAAAPEGNRPRDTASELAYLRGRIAYDRKELDVAQGEFARVDRSSRLYAGAAYFRGLIAARRRAFQEARAAFCEIAAPGEEGRLAFAVDARYFGLKDLAHLALARVAHEQDRYDEAYYHYFSVPEDSERLAEALFEAAWSMYSKGENEAARAFADQFDRLFPRSPLRAEVALLRANLAVKSCAFDRARAEAAALEQTYAPMAREVAAALARPARRRELLERLLEPVPSGGGASDVDAQLLALLRLDARFEPLLAMARDVDGDVAEATAAVTMWRALGDEVRGGKVALAPASTEAARLLEDVSALAPAAAHDPALSRRAADLLLLASLRAYPPSAAGPYAAEAQAAEELGRRLVALRAKVLDSAQTLATEALRDLDARLRSTLRQARLVHIDAVVGKKKKLEAEIARLAAGKLPASLYYKLQAEGALADDEEYWPFEGEYWSDEYYGFK